MCVCVCLCVLTVVLTFRCFLFTFSVHSLTHCLHLDSIDVCVVVVVVVVVVADTQRSYSHLSLKTTGVLPLLQKPGADQTDQANYLKSFGQSPQLISADTSVEFVCLLQADKSPVRALGL